MAEKDCALRDGLLDRLQGDGFSVIGDFHIEVPFFHYRVETAAAFDWTFSVYAWVSAAGEGRVMRIGKCEGKLWTRLAAYKRSLDAAMSVRLGANEYFKGDTQPWELEGWVHFAGGEAGGLIFAKSLDQQALGGTPRVALAGNEAQLIARYDPPLCGVSLSGRRAKQKWEILHGRTTAILQQSRASANQASWDRAYAPAR